MKTTRQQLRKYLTKKEFKNILKYIDQSDLSEPCDDIVDFIGSSFRFDKTSEGNIYWEQILNRISYEVNNELEDNIKKKLLKIPYSIYTPLMEQAKQKDIPLSQHMNNIFRKHNKSVAQ